jgi:hypothetical protein
VPILLWSVDEAAEPLMLTRMPERYWPSKKKMEVKVLQRKGGKLGMK